MRWTALALVFLALLLPATAPRALGQDADWSLVYSRNDDRVADIAMFDDVFGLAQSGYGVLRTVDGGRTWTEPPSRPVIGYGVIGFADRDHAWITGNSGIWRTDDGGLNWQRQTGGAGPGSASLAVIDADEAWITGAASDFSDIPSFAYPSNRLIHTVDGGATWTPVEIPGAGRYLSVQFVGRDGWVAASPCNPGDAQSATGNAPICPDTTILFHTDDGGASWSIVAREPDVPVIPREVRFVDASHGVGINRFCANCPQDLYGSDDGGATWAVRAEGAVTFSMEGTELGWVAFEKCFGGCLQVSRSLDAGRRWSSPILVPDDPGARNSFAPVLAATHEAVLISGGVSGIRRYDLETRSWSAAVTEVHGSMANVSFETRDRGYATAHGVLWRSEDAGATWSPQSPTPPFEKLVVSPGALWIASSANCTNNCPQYIYRSIDQGRSWQPVTIPSRQKASGLQATDVDHAWYFAEDGLWRTEDGGLNWALVDADPAAATKGYRFIDAENGWRGVCSAPPCSSSSLALTSDGGDTWQPRPPPPDVIVTQVFTPLTAFGFRASTPMCHCQDAMVKTSDGGLTWTDVGNAEFALAFLSVTFFDDAHGVALGDRGQDHAVPAFFETDDAGASWRPHALPPLEFPLGELLAQDGRVWFLDGLSESPFPGSDRQLLFRRDVFPESIPSPSPTTGQRDDSGHRRAALIAGLLAGLTATAAFAGIPLLVRRRRSEARP